MHKKIDMAAFLLIPAIGLAPRDSGVIVKIILIISLVGLIYFNWNNKAARLILSPWAVCSLVFLMASFLLGYHGDLSHFRGWATDSQIIIYGLIFWFYFGLTYLKSDACVSALSSAIRLAIALSLVRLVIGYVSGDYGFTEYHGRYRMGTFLGPSAGSIFYLALLIPSFSGWVVDGKKTDLIYTIIALSMILSTATRITIFALLVILPIGALWVRKASERGNIGMMIGVVTMFAIMYSGVELVQPGEDPYKHGLAISLSGGAGVTLISSGRHEAWPLFIKKAMEAPLLGHGVGSTSLYLKSWNDPNFDQIHNDYLKIFFNSGLVGLGIFFGAIYILARFILAKQPISASSEILKLSSINYLAGLLVTMLTDNTLAYHFYLFPACLVVVYFLSIPSRSEIQVR